MAEVDKGVLLEILKTVMTLVIGRDEREAGHQAGKLRFWKDGMLKELEELAEGEGSPGKLGALREKFFERQDEVSAAIIVMKKVRDKLGGGPVAKAIDDVLHDEDYGKICIRTAISSLLGSNRWHEYSELEARQIVGRIAALNAALDRLQRLVDG